MRQHLRTRFVWHKSLDFLMDSVCTAWTSVISFLVVTQTFVTTLPLRMFTANIRRNDVSTNVSTTIKSTSSIHFVVVTQTFVTTLPLRMFTANIRKNDVSTNVSTTIKSIRLSAIAIHNEVQYQPDPKEWQLGTSVVPSPLPSQLFVDVFSSNMFNVLDA